MSLAVSNFWHTGGTQPRATDDFRIASYSGTIPGRDCQSATNDVCSVPRLIAPESSALVAQLNSFLLGEIIT